MWLKLKLSLSVFFKKSILENFKALSSVLFITGILIYNLSNNNPGLNQKIQKV